MSHIGIYYGFFDKTTNITHLMSHSWEKKSKIQRNHKILKIILSSPYPGFPSENICISIRPPPDVDGLGCTRFFFTNRHRRTMNFKIFPIVCQASQAIRHSQIQSASGRGGDCNHGITVASYIRLLM